VIYGDGEQLRDYVFVGDVARANLLALERLLSGNACGAAPGGCAINDFAFNIGTGCGVSVNELFAILKEITGFQGEATHGPERTGELRRVYLDTSKARQEMGWAPQVSLEEGLRRTVSFLAGRSSIIRVKITTNTAMAEGPAPRDRS
jgi:UDP-glucose 4-epimerase